MAVSIVSPAIEDGPVRVFCGHVLDVLRELPRESVHMVCTSPPFYGLRDYGTTPQIWGGDPPDGCKHEWGSAMSVHQGGPHGGGGMLAGGRGVVEAQAAVKDRRAGQRCLGCGAWRGELGLEPMPDCLAWARREPPCASCWVCHLRTICAGLWRVLRRDGTMWLQLGDSYAGRGGRQGPRESPGGLYGHSIANHPKRASHAGSVRQVGLNPKDLIGTPWRAALALQADGWYLRSDIVWAKPNPLPESVRDRPTKSHEYLFLLTKARYYFYDAEAVKEGAAYVGPNGAQSSPYGQGFTRRSQAGQDQNGAAQIKGGDRYTGFNSRWDAQRAAEGPALSRNIRSVWTIATQPHAEGHFATFPEKLVEPCIKSGTSDHGVCAECGAPWRRVVERTGHVNGREKAHQPGNTPTKTDSTGWAPTRRATSEWQPTCAHNAPPIPATVLDPFAGSGTTLAVARRMGRRSVGIELQRDYLPLIRHRIEQRALPLVEKASTLGAWPAVEEISSQLAERGGLEALWEHDPGAYSSHCSMADCDHGITPQGGSPVEAT